MAGGNQELRLDVISPRSAPSLARDRSPWSRFRFALIAGMSEIQAPSILYANTCAGDRGLARVRRVPSPLSSFGAAAICARCPAARPERPRAAGLARMPRLALRRRGVGDVVESVRPARRPNSIRVGRAGSSKWADAACGAAAAGRGRGAGTARLDRFAGRGSARRPSPLRRFDLGRGMPDLRPAWLGKRDRFGDAGRLVAARLRRYDGV